jgi:hypothetical protein
MSNASYAGWNHAGFSYLHTTAITSTRQYLLVQRDTTNAPESTAVPRNGYVESLEVELDTIAAGATSLLLSLWRDVNGVRMFVGETTATIVLGAVATNGGVSVKIDRDHHFITGLSTANIQDPNGANLYIGVSTNAGTANAKFILNWRW